MPVITHDTAETERRMAFASDLFGETIELKPGSFDWATIAMEVFGK